MNPIIAFLLAHPAADWNTQRVRQNYADTYGEVSAGTWTAALQEARRLDYVRRTIEQAHAGDTMGQVLYGVLAFGDNVTIRVRVTGTDSWGHRMSALVDVEAGRDDTMQDVENAAWAEIEALYGAGAIQFDSLEIAHGSYAS